MTNIEVYTDPNRDIFNNTLKAIGDNYPINMIFNRHADGLDARCSVERVMDDSIVFIEWFKMNSTEYDLKHDLENLLQIEMSYGKDSEQYSDLKMSFLNDLRRLKYVPSSGYLDFSQHMAVELEGLLEKGCSVLVADYQESANEELNIKKGEDITTPLPLTPESVLDGGIGRSYKLLLRHHVDDSIYHFKRESSALKEITRYLYKYGSDDPSNEQGRGVYLIYGAAHQDSLVSVIEKNPLPFTIGSVEVLHTVKPLDRILDINFTRSVLYKKVANTAIQSISSQLDIGIDIDNLLDGNDTDQSVSELAHLYTIMSLQALQAIGRYDKTEDDAYANEVMYILNAMKVV